MDKVNDLLKKIGSIESQIVLLKDENTLAINMHQIKLLESEKVQLMRNLEAAYNIKAHRGNNVWNKIMWRIIAPGIAGAVSGCLIVWFTM